MYILIDLGTFPKGQSTSPRAINNHGLVVGSAITQNGDTHGFLWKSGKMTDLSTLPGEGKHSTAYAINDFNHIVGVSDVATSDESHACLWAGGPPQDLGNFGEDSVAFDINNSDHIVGGFGNFAGEVWPCIWRGGQRQKLTLRTQKFDDLGRVFGINGKDQMVGYAGMKAILESIAVVWVSQGQSYFTIEPPSSLNSEAIAINNQGQIAGSVTDPGGYAFLREVSNLTMITILGTLPGYGGSIASDVNSSGEIVGLAFSPTQGELPHAFLWSKGKMSDLNDFIDPNSGWELTHAESINDRGQIVGTGRFNGQERGWLLDPIIIGVSNIPGYVVQIVFGLVAGGGGLVIDPQGRVIPIDPPNPVWQSLSPAVRDILVGLALNQVASQMNNEQTRKEIQRAALNIVSIEVQQLLHTLAEE